MLGYSEWNFRSTVVAVQCVKTGGRIRIVAADGCRQNPDLAGIRHRMQTSHRTHVITIGVDISVEDHGDRLLGK